MAASPSFAPSSWLTRLMLWPFRLAWALATWLVSLIGILMGLLLGFALMAVGWLLCTAIITAFLGIPMFIFGLLLVLRALY